ncbi:uncharacterized protein LOC113390515 [Ctenocephalides felis]|uniref:uncharacterized protein LOC113390515 n=1 Tax=Ctenocephalides felis TaxID=7515 RepID=UPI000E6E38F4|nr:uncharacterized protein LOC113390515 [Ctenocephalides felis]
MSGGSSRDRDIGRKWKSRALKRNAVPYVQPSSEFQYDEISHEIFYWCHCFTVYSIFQDKVYCFPCRLFSHLRTQVVMEGCCDWKDLSRILQRHEQRQGHKECMIKWMELYKAIKYGKTIDKDNEKSIKGSQKYWFNLFERMIDVINYLAVHNLSFRGHRESLKFSNRRNSDNFIDLFKLLSKSDSTLRVEHMHRINEKNTYSTLSEP